MCVHTCVCIGLALNLSHPSFSFVGSVEAARGHGAACGRSSLGRRVPRARGRLGRPSAALHFNRARAGKILFITEHIQPFHINAVVVFTPSRSQPKSASCVGATWEAFCCSTLQPGTRR